MNKVKPLQDLVLNKLFSNQSNASLWGTHKKSKRDLFMVDLYRERVLNQNVTNLNDRKLIRQKGLLKQPVVYLKGKKGEKSKVSLQINKGHLSIKVATFVFTYTQDLTPSTTSAMRTAGHIAAPHGPNVELSSMLQPTLQFVPKGRLNAQIANILKNGNPTEKFLFPFQALRALDQKFHKNWDQNTAIIHRHQREEQHRQGMRNLALLIGSILFAIILGLQLSSQTSAGKDS